MNVPIPAYVAVDLGAGSGRVIVARLSPDHFRMDEVRRFNYDPALRGGYLKWPSGKIFDEVKAGLRQAAAFARSTDAAVVSIGVDAWGVDYGLIDSDGRLCDDPVCYRDSRTDGVMEKVFQKIPREEIYARTGIQFLQFNTLFQLAAHAETGIPKQAVRLLLVPDLIHFFLTGRAVNEYTNATTTQMLDVRHGTWDSEMLGRLGLPTRLLGEVVPEGTSLGPLLPSLAEELGLPGVTVVAPATHDTASAVVGTPLADGFAYISSGTWSLAGVEVAGPIINADTARDNYTNEGGAFGMTRFLKNVMGLWIFESCRREWKQRTQDLPYDEWLGRIDAETPSVGLIYPDDPRFLAPPSMSEAVSAQMTETGQEAPSEPVETTKVILDSLAFRYASVLRTIERLTGPIRGVHIVGGGSQNDYLNQATANASNLPVVAGPVEAAAIGNALVQAIRDGRFTTLEEGRAYVRTHTELSRFLPRSSKSWEEAAARYASIEDAQVQKS